MSPLFASRMGRLLILLTAASALLPALPAHGQGDLHRAIPPQGRALVFVYRVSRDPAADRIPVTVNKVPVGELGHGNFVSATINAGVAELRIGQRLVRTLTFAAAPNQTYFVRVQALDDRTPARVDAQSVSEAEGRSAVAQSRLVGSAPVFVIPPVAPPSVVVPPAAPPPVAAPAAVPPAAPPQVATPPVAVPSPVKPPVAVPPAEPAVVAETVPARSAPTQDASVFTEPRRDSSFTLIANAGTFKLADERQSVGGFPAVYDTTSKSVLGVEAEWRRSSGFSIGGEFFTYKNDLVTTATTPNAQQKVYAVMLNGKYYFYAAEWFQPFVGVGVGQAHATYSGGMTGTATGLAYQGMAGMEFRFRPVGIYVQFKYFASETGDSSKAVKVGGSGVLAGVSLSF